MDNPQTESSQPIMQGQPLSWSESDIAELVGLDESDNVVTAMINEVTTRIVENYPVMSAMMLAIQVDNGTDE